MGTIVISAPAIAPRPVLSASVPGIVHEDVRDQLVRSFRFAARLLDRIDPVARATDVLPAAGLLNSGEIPWRTQAEQQASPNMASLNPFSPTEAALTLNPPLQRRAMLERDAGDIAADHTELLARDFRPRQ